MNALGPIKDWKRFMAMIPFLWKWEGMTFENDPNDPGGATKYGIDQRSHPRENIRALTQERAIEIYYREYWDRYRCGEMPEKIGEVYFNGCVNCGAGRATKILHDPAYPHTAAGFLDGQDAFYHRLAEARPSARKYLKGWLNRTADLRRFVGA